MSFRSIRAPWFLAVLLGITMAATACSGATSSPAASPTKAPAAAPTQAAAPTTAPTQAAAGAAAAATSAPSGTTQKFDGTILIGDSTSLTGSLAVEAGLTLNGAKLAIDQYNKAGGVLVGGKHYQLVLKTYDDESKSDTTVQLIQKLITQDHVQFLLSPYSSGQVQAGAPIAEKYKTIMINDGGAADSLFTRGFKYMFTDNVLASHYLYSTIDMALAQNPPVKKIALIGANDVFSTTVLKGAEAYAKSKGLDVVYTTTYPPTTQDLSTILTAVKQAQPDALFGSGHFEDAILTVRQAKQLGVNVKMMGFTVGPSTPDFANSLGADANYVLGPVSWSPQQKNTSDDIFKSSANFAALYKAKFNQDPDYHSAQGGAGVVALVTAIQNANSLDTAKVQQALVNLNVKSFWGQLKFNAQGVTAAQNDVVEQIQNKTHVLVWPTDVAAGKLQYPMPAWNKR